MQVFLQIILVLMTAGKFGHGEIGSMQKEQFKHRSAEGIGHNTFPNSVT
jgi:hypothetical protein